MKFFLAILATAAFTFGFAGTAEASRPVPGYPYTDQCDNFKGKQPIYMLYGTGPYREKTGTKNPNDCRYVG